MNMHQLWSWLTEPIAQNLTSEERRHCQLLASMLVTLLPLGIFIASLPPLFEGAAVWQDNDFVTVVSASLFWVVAYHLSRTGRYLPAALLVLFVGLLAILLIVIFDQDVGDLQTVILPLLASSVVLPLHYTIGFTGLTLLSILVVPLFQPAIRFGEVISGPFSFVCLAALLIVLTARHRDRLEQDRRLILSENEKRYRTLFETTFEGLVLYEDGLIRDANLGLTRIFGYRLPELLSLPVANLFNPESRPALLERLQRGGQEPFDARGLRKDGALLYLELIVSSQQSEGETKQVLAIRDLTERRQAEDALRAAQRLDSLGSLAGGIAHDFNNLLLAIMGQSSLAMQKLPKESLARANIEKALKAAERAAELTQQLLTYAGRRPTQRTPLDLNQLIEEMQDLFASALPRKGWLKLVLSPSLPTVEADRAQMQQVLMNLVINATQAFRHEQDTVTISTYSWRIPKPWLDEHYVGNRDLVHRPCVCIEVADTGSGISSEILAHVFDPFFTTKPGGHGLGLAAVLGIVRIHQGGIKVTSSLGRGTVFTVCLPSSNQTFASAIPINATTLVTPVARGTVLIIDDEPAVREVATDILNLAGIETLRASGGAEGVALYQAHQPAIHLVLLDVQMPEMNGEETFHRLRQLDPKVKVLFSSGYTTSDSVRQLVSQGAAHFLPKPYNFDTLVNTVQSLIASERVG
jgi:PAS domain S-box-containing protein